MPPLLSSMAQAEPEDDTHAPLRSTENPGGPFSTWYRNPSSEPSTPMVVVRNPMVIHGSSSESGTPVSGEEDQNKEDRDERDQDEESHASFRDAVETSPYSTPNPQSTTRPGQAQLDPSPSETETRGTKRPHEPEPTDPSGVLTRRINKRLNTREETMLFMICNNHADSFGRRSDICNWWKKVAAEFTRNSSRSYSWHSVRRRVEMVTKQRIKFLADQEHRQDLTQDKVDPFWRTTIDEWIPTWKRWEESEARRIKQRDEMLRRRSQPRPDVFSTLEVLRERARRSPDGVDADLDHSMNDDLPSEADAPVTIASPVPAPAATFPATHTGYPPRRMASSVKMPPGFETMFSRPQPPRSRTPPIPMSVSNTSTNTHTNTAPAPAPAPAPISNPPSDGSMVNAVMETLGKLNRHLDAAAGSGGHDARPSPIVSVLGRGAVDSPIRAHESLRQPNTPAVTAADLARIKEELRQEMLAELDEYRVHMQNTLDSILRAVRMRGLQPSM